MSKVEFYRVAADGQPTRFGPYDAISSARNVASIHLAYGWEGVNSRTKEVSVYDWNTETIATKTVKYTIQKLTPVFRQIHPSGAFALSMEWVDLDG
jgi:hypothetical protein